MPKKRGHFIVFEGIDGSGKSTQISLLKQRIEALSLPCIATKEPSDGPVGMLLRQFLTSRIQGDESTISALFAADRLDHLYNPVNGLCKSVEEGFTVLCDRYLLSNYAYQSVRVPLGWVMETNSLAAEALKPDCHIFIDVAPEITLERMEKTRSQTELFETKDRLREVRDRYYDLIEQLKHQETIFVIDGNRSLEEIADDIWSKVCSYFME